ncbi:MAG: FkbM family methyltransferase [Pseudomarimonas sp.]
MFRGFNQASRKLARTFLNALGIEIRQIRNVRAARLQQRKQREIAAWSVLSHHRFACVLDIGANTGQFASIARLLWPEALVHSFEPLPDIFAELKANHANDPKVIPHHIGLSDQAGMQSMFRSAFSPSSSLLPMAKLHEQEWPQSVANTEVAVKLERLDVWRRSMGAELTFPLMVKIDVQGFEMSVINGGPETLQQASVVVIEVSFHELYAAQPLFGEIHKRLTDLGFIYRGNIEEFRSRDGKNVLFADAIFENLANISAYD